ncbi:MAG: NAD(P)/FAD-dependent oxidoreductase [Ruminococcus sp.]|nr:NAD(P)/FAD-dependent oxidoreductase [Ruminococcus sp.]
MVSKKVVVIGAGAAGLMAAGFAAENGANVTVIEKNKRVGRKIMITGKGRCNVTNDCDVQTYIRNVPVNGRFLYSAINNFTPQDTIYFFEELGLSLKTERGNRVFPESDKALDVVDTLHDFILDKGCKLVCDTAKALIIEDGEVIGVKCEEETYYADSVIICCGGKSYPLTGSTGDGYTLAKQAGHTVTELKPSLVPLESKNTDCKSMQGLALKNVGLKIIDNNSKKTVYTDFGEMLFTHFGVSGPMILSASSHIRDITEGKYTAEIDLKPALSLEQLDKRIQNDFRENANKDVSNSFSKLLPRKIIIPVLKRWGVPFDKKCNSITKEERKKLCELLKVFTVDISGFRPIEEAIITSGGVKTSEINPKTMESKLVHGLYFAGEVIDCDAYTGGFNLQIAWSTGKLAGENSAYFD